MAEAKDALMTVPLQNGHVLVVDDDPDIVVTLTDFLESEGYRVDSAGTGISAIDKVHHNRFNVVILDLGLPDRDGLSVLESIQQLDPHLPVVILTAFTNSERTIGSLFQGAFAYLTKPYNRAELRATIRRALGVQALTAKTRVIEEALSESEERFRAIVQSAPDAIIVSSEDGRITSWNRAAAALFGHDERDMLGQPFTALIAPPDHARCQEATARCVPSDATAGEPAPVELTGRHRSGALFPMEVSFATWTVGRHRSFSAIARTITDRKRAEAELRESEMRFRQLAENIRDVFWLTDPEKGTMLYVSPAYETIWMRSCRSLYENPLSWLDAIHPDDRPRIEAAARHNQASGQYAETYRIVRPNGSIRWIRDRAFPVLNDQGVIYRIAGLAEDITDTHRHP